MIPTEVIDYYIQEGDRSGCSWFKGNYIRFSNPNWNMGGGQMDMKDDMYMSGAKSSITAAFTAGALAAAATQF